MFPISANNANNDIGDVRRFSGLVSGLDTEAIVAKLMQAERLPLNKLLQQKQWLNWQRDAYREVNRSLLDVRTKLADLRLAGTFLAQSAQSSRNDLFSVTATGSALPGQHTVEVMQLAQPARVIGAQIQGAKATTLLTDLNDASGNPLKEGTYTFTIEVSDVDTGTLLQSTITIDHTSGTRTIKDVVDAINAQKVAVPDGNGGTIEKPLGVKAMFDATTERVVLQTDLSGAYSITIEDDPASSASLAQALGIATSNNPATNKPYADQVQIGQNAEVIVDGVTVTARDNRLTVFGLNLDLKRAEPGTTVTVTALPATDQLVDKIKNFVETVNTLIEDLNRRLSEPRYRDYPPLTDEQKRAMTERQIEQWEERARSGLLARDMTVDRIVSDLRMALVTPVEMGDGRTISLSEIGITTGSYWEKGKLILDENKLKEALLSRPEDVSALFSQKLGSDAAPFDTNHPLHAQKGIGVRLYEVLSGAMDRLVQKAGRDGIIGLDQSSLGTQLKSLDGRIDTFERRLKDIEERYWRQFTAMEKAIQRANMQSAWLMQQFMNGS
ncbi:MAG: Flagellar hook-associated protein FliD [Candidatus Carbobacillus altaicus]|uniref:Flagellar hook-associated protein 2 n=1 Tax=Candidatus Carbonibacillus altaicus TaxID=2163959 RepID=A0A2R6Y0I4_9BACL|nr:MAG: Flagellar hook-associated protein FliD [Candidatus Carbobacillus altaicus]